MFVRGSAGVAGPRVSAKDEPGPPQVRSLRRSQSRREARRGLGGGRRNSRGHQATSAGSRGLALGTCLAKLGAPQVTLGTGGRVTAAESDSFLRCSPLPTTALAGGVTRDRRAAQGGRGGAEGPQPASCQSPQDRSRGRCQSQGSPEGRCRGPALGLGESPPPGARLPPLPRARTKEE